MKIVIIIPSYNEAENIKLLIPNLEEEFKLIPNHEMHILVVDSKSPDGTGQIVKEMATKYPNVFLLETPKEGLGAAYIKGMKHAMKELNAEAVIEMDADFQHDPKDIKRLVKEMDNGFDYVLGSRFIKGGSIPKDWGIHRKFLSIVGNLFARTILGLYRIHDLTTGFKLSRVKNFLDKIDLDSVISKSYAYKIHLLYEMVRLKAKVKEIPIDFLNRERGSSKMDSEDFIESLRVVFTIRLRSILKK